MQVLPLSVANILRYGSTAHRNTEVRTYAPAATEPRITSFSEIAARCGALAHALRDAAGVATGDRIATIMPNTGEHLEIMLATASMGAVFNPINRYLQDDQISHILNHAESRVLITTPVLAQRVIPLLPQCATVAALIIVPIPGESFSLEEGHHWVTEAFRGKFNRPPAVYEYESLLDERPTVYDWPEVAETDAAAMCYSTGTTGAPKAVVYSHRALWLHSMALRAADSFGVRNGTPFLCCVPIYHVLSWGVPLAAFMAGAPLVFTGGDVSPAHVAAVIADAMPRQAAGSPVVWTQLLVHYSELEQPSKMTLQEIFSGGSAVPPALIAGWEERFGVDVVHTWGMTETGPVGTVAHPPAGLAGPARARYRESQGRFHVGMEYRIVDGDSQEVLAHNDRNVGELQVRGNTVTASYYHSPAQEFDATHDGAAAVFRGHAVDDAPNRFTDDGWLRTGDIATITQDGYLTVHDRKSDLIRSGGEWIYSAALENLLAESELVLEAAVIGIPNEKWGQRPLAIVVLMDHSTAGIEAARAIRDDLRRQVPEWMLPDHWTFVEEIDKTSVDKFDKLDLHAHFLRGDFEIFTLQRR